MLAKNKIKISLMQNTAISLELCLEDKYGTIDEFEKELQKNFKTELLKNVSLYTVRNANLEGGNKIYKDKNVLLEQSSNRTIQVVTN